MTFIDIILLALRSVRANLLRTSLTLSIIAIGIMALVGILTATDGIKAGLSNSLSRVGANTFEIERIRGPRGRGGGSNVKSADPISYNQAVDFKERFGYPAQVSMTVPVKFLVTGKYKDRKSDPNIFIRAVDENYLQASGIDIEYGRNFSANEVKSGNSLIIIGEGIAKKLFVKAKKAIGEIISLNGKKYQVLGTLKDSGSSGLFSSSNMALISTMNAQLKYPESKRSYELLVAVDQAESLELAISETMGLMRSVRKLSISEAADFEITKSDKLASILIENTSTIVLAATVIGAITLMGAAIGLMNIMLVSVVERTREIGVSKALGANNSTILMQFLGEAVVIGQLGGFFGIILGIIVGNVVSFFVNGPFIIPWLWITMGVVFCFVVGIVSGIYPAVVASRLDPIESLRYE